MVHVGKCCGKRPKKVSGNGHATGKEGDMVQTGGLRTVMGRKEDDE